MSMRAQRTLHIREGLIRSVLASVPPSPPRKEKRKYQYVIRDEDVALIRGDRELRGMMTRAIAKSRGFTLGQVEAVTEYRSRIHIDPK